MHRKIIFFIILTVNLILCSNIISGARYSPTLKGYCNNCHIILLGEQGDIHQIHYFGSPLMEARDPGRRIPCIGCHQIGTKIQAQGIACHNPGLIDSVHKKTCLICHKRMLNTENESAIHAIHAKKECVLCHREPAKPSSECTSCHGNDHHRVHQRVVDKICVKCHGEIEKAYINISTFEQTQKNVTAYKLKSTLAKKFSYVKKLIKSILDKFLVY